MHLAHLWRSVPQIDMQGLKKKQCRLGDLPGVWENCILRTHLGVYRTLPLFATQNGSPASSLRLRLVLLELALRVKWLSHDAPRQAEQGQQNL